MREVVPRFVTVDDALRLDRREIRGLHERHLDPRLARLLEIIGANRQFVRAEGVCAWDADGHRYLDFLAGFGALALGHNHPRVHAALEAMRWRPNLVEDVSALEGALAHDLATLAGHGLDRVHFACSGTEAVDAALKLARAATRRVKLVACEKGFHGRSVGALSITQRAEYRLPFGPLLSDVAFVRFGDTDGLAAVLRGGDVAAFVVEPVQGEAGIVPPPPGYLAAARELCSQYGTLLVADEIQTGLGRTGTLFAFEPEGAVPDALLLGKALGGGLMPISAVLTTDALFRAAGGGTPRSPFHSATFGGNPRACAAALAALEVITSENLPRRAGEGGAYLLARLRELQARQPSILAVRGRGLLVGVELGPPAGDRWRGPAGRALDRVADRYLTGIVIMQLLKRHRILTAFTLNQPNVLRLEPPLIVDRSHLDEAVAALDEVLGSLGGMAWATFRAAPALVRALMA